MGRYSLVLTEHFLQPRNCGGMESPDLMGLVGVPGRGPFQLLCLRVREGRIAESRYQTHGCGASIAAGSMLTVLIRNRSIEECLALTVEQLTDALGGVPPDKAHCPAMAVAALRNALREYVPVQPVNQ